MFPNSPLMLGQIVTACAISGALQSLVGGQPLMIVGVAEPIVLVYAYMYVSYGSCADNCDGML